MTSATTPSEDTGLSAPSDQGALPEERATQGTVERVERAETLRRVIPAVDIVEGAADTLLIADLPGVTQSGLELELEHNELRLRARAEARFDDAPFEYARSFRLPPGIEAEKVTADLKDGVLTLTLPKPAALKPRRIDVRVA